MTEWSDFLARHNIRCEICGKLSVDWSNFWFLYQPCEDHRHLTPEQYHDMKQRVKRMTKITATKMVRQEVEFDVDDRIYDEDCMAWKIANIILEGRLEETVKYLYDDDDYNIITYTVEKINDTFKMADKIMEL